MQSKGSLDTPREKDRTAKTFLQGQVYSDTVQKTTHHKNTGLIDRKPKGSEKQILFDACLKRQSSCCGQIGTGGAQGIIELQ